MKNIIEIKRQDNTFWSLYVNGQNVMRDESYAVVCNVEASLRGSHSNSECDEVAATVGGGVIDPEDYIEYQDREEAIRLMGRMDDEPEQSTCPQCGGPGSELGSLGKTTWLRCRDCGWEFTG